MDGETESERAHGLALETCYRHPSVVTGVHCTRCGRPICPDCMNPAPVGYQCPRCLAEARGGRARATLRPRVRGPRSVTTIVMVVNVAMFVVEVVLGGNASLFAGPNAQTLFDLGALFPPKVAAGQYWRLLTPMLLHASLLHIALNSYALYLFGYLIEGVFGWARFLAIYVVSGFLASVASFVFGSPGSLGVGASGAIFGLLGAWVAYNFRRRGTAFADANLQSAMLIIAINLFLGFSIAQIDNFAHIGGLVAGAAAGGLAEGFGPTSLRSLIRVGGFAVLVAVGIALTAYRVSALT